MNRHHVVLRSALPLAAVTRAVNDGYAHLGAHVSAIRSDNPLDEVPDVSVVGQLIGFARSWAVEAHITDRGDARIVELVAVGDEPLMAAARLFDRVYSLKKSTEQLERIAAVIRAVDPSCTRVSG